MNLDRIKTINWIIVLGVAFLVSESACRGFTKVCYYDYLGNTYALTISCTELCPLSIPLGEET